MRKVIQYSTLKYCHSAFLSEQLNIGLLFYDYNESKLEFYFPASLQRLTSAYHGISHAFLKRYLTDFFHTAEKLTNYWKDKLEYIRPDDLGKIINDYFIIEDGSSLQFSPVESIFSENSSNTINFLSTQYFQFYHNEVSAHYDEGKIEEFFRENLKKSPEAYKKVKQERELKSTHFNQKFPFSWKNGTENLITPISFDLKDRDHIKKKVFQWKGLLDDFEEVSQRENVQFHLLISRPRIRENYKAYDNALNVLEEIRSGKRILEEENYHGYVDEVINKVLNY